MSIYPIPFVHKIPRITHFLCSLLVPCDPVAAAFQVEGVKGDGDGLAGGRDDVEAVFIIGVVARPARRSDLPTCRSVYVTCEGSHSQIKFSTRALLCYCKHCKRTHIIFSSHLYIAHSRKNFPNMADCRCKPYSEILCQNSLHILHLLSKNSRHPNLPMILQLQRLSINTPLGNLGRIFIHKTYNCEILIKRYVFLILLYSLLQFPVSVGVAAHI